MYNFYLWWIRGYEIETGVIRADSELEARIELGLFHYPERVTIITLKKAVFKR